MIEDWETPVMVHVYLYWRRNQVCPRASQSNMSGPVFRVRPRRDSYCSWGLVSLCASKILGDKFIEINQSIFDELSDFYVWKVVPFGALPHS